MGKRDLGKTIRSIRRGHDLTQAQLAEKMGVSPSTVAMWETGKRAPDVDKIGALARALGVSAGRLVTEGGGESEFPANAIPLAQRRMKAVPVIGAVRCGPGGTAIEEREGYELADVEDGGAYFYLRVVGDSMEPQISEGDLALVRRQEDVESGELAVAVIGGEEGTLKRVQKSGGAVALQAFNPAYPTRIFTGAEIGEIRIVGKVVETKRRW